VTLYQQGWRLGGKGASGRGPAGRIEEHGIHVWMGFYENSFRLLRECYRELNRDPRKCRFADWRDAFSPEPLVGAMDRSRTGRWIPWLAYFPPAEGIPGDIPAANSFEVRDYLIRTVTLIRTLLIAAQDSPDIQAVHRTRLAVNQTASQASVRGVLPPAGEIVRTIKRSLTYGLIATTTGLIEAVNLVEAMLERVPGYPADLALRLVRTISESVHAQLRSLIDGDDEARRLWEMVDLALAVIFGIFRYGLISHPEGLDAINDFDLVQWLRLNGASESSLNSTILHALYDLPFAYEDGDPCMPRLAAGVALRGAFRLLFTYRGSMVWKLNAGMGDVVFAPFYQLLKERGITFKFFHRLRKVKLCEQVGANERPYVESLEFDEQAQVKNESGYQPLIDVRGLPCWPSEPDYEQLIDGEKLQNERWEFESHWERRTIRTRALRVTEDFDCVVLAVGLGAIPYVCSELVERDPRWRAMIAHCKTTATQAFQVWMTEEIEELAMVGTQTTITGFVQPFETCADMRQMIAQENWKVRPRSAAYFCGVLPDQQLPHDPADPQFLEKAQERVRRNAVRFLRRDIVHLWPNVVGENGFRWSLLMNPAATEAERNKSDESQFDSQFWTANVNPSDRYCLSLPKTLCYRISPLDNTYDNLTVAGDWTECGLNTGCVEAAVISGRLAANAICGFPRLREIVGYDHP
jgi:uncharacterized protein with NAD-binding domain and iron-sulfur cluster